MRDMSTNSPASSSGSQPDCPSKRWRPDKKQLQILEHEFLQVDETPSFKKMEELTASLSEHGKVELRNIGNWFRNRRSKERQQNNKKKTQETVELDNRMDEQKIKPELNLHESGLVIVEFKE